MLTRKVSKLFMYILLIVIAAVFLFPIVFMIVSSLKVDESQILSDMSGIKGFIPYGKLGLKNYFDVFKNMAFGKFYFNSVLITTITVMLGLVVNSMLAFALARYEFKGSKYIIIGVLALMIIPIEAVVIPMLLMVNKWGVMDTYIVQILPYIADPLYIFLFYQFFRELPTSLEEAAVIDGSSYFRIYWQIGLPLSKPVFVSVGILCSIARWGEFLWPLMTTRGEEHRPLTVAIQQLFTINPKNWGDIFAFATMITIPLLIIFVIFQKYFVDSIASSGIKG
ncbi:carbohydrate ABC transporter permease [Vallitalea guaymasensis]|uniref:carbohydrate ABC transporter permease n=1 Tax=Vallitalea guaymasensis TaxID=1185412 RepID=UPI002352D334|nr:carbohydrate ABC transporter permease [Vallitalea guaymasensis]